MRCVAAPLVASLLAFGAVAAYAQATANSAGLTWAPAPAVFPAGAKMAVVSGDPGKSGPFTIQLSMPDGYKIKRHTHPTDEHATIVAGTFLVGMGDTWTATQLKPMTTGATGSIPANMAHFAAAKGKTVVQIESTGPLAMTYVNPADDPRTSSTQ